MSAPCVACGYDAGFDAVVCPNCGNGLAASGPSFRQAAAGGGTDVTIATERAGGWEPDETVLPNEATRAHGRQGHGACFIVTSGPARGKRYLLGQRSIVGRAVDADVRLNDPRVSSRHAMVRWSGRQFTFQDLTATNGSFLLIGQREQRLGGIHVLRNNDELKLGDTVLRFIAMGGGGLE